MELIRLLEKSFAGLNKCAIAFSGGLDSSLLAAIARERCVLYTAGLPGCKDIQSAQRAAAILGLDLKIIELQPEQILQAWCEMHKLLNVDKFTASFHLPLWFVCARAKEKVIVSGYGADELTAGYAKYRKMKDLSAALAQDARSAKSDPIPRAIAEYFNKRLILPYLENETFNFLLALPLKYKLGSQNKIILRSALRALGFSQLAEIKKRAAQYGSGIAKVLKTE